MCLGICLYSQHNIYIILMHLLWRLLNAKLQLENSSITLKIIINKLIKKYVLYATHIVLVELLKYL